MTVQATGNWQYGPVSEEEEGLGAEEAFSGMIAVSEDGSGGELTLTLTAVAGEKRERKTAYKLMGVHVTTPTVAGTRSAALMVGGGRRNFPGTNPPQYTHPVEVVQTLAGVLSTLYSIRGEHGVWVANLPWIVPNRGQLESLFLVQFRKLNQNEGQYVLNAWGYCRRVFP